MLRYRVMLTGPRRESKGKVRDSPSGGWACLLLASLCCFGVCAAHVLCPLLPSPAIHQKLSFSALVPFPLHLFPSLSPGSVLSVIMDVPPLPLGGGCLEMPLVQGFCGYTVRKTTAENLGKRMELIDLIYFPSGTMEFSFGYNHGFLSSHWDALNCKLSLNHLLGGDVLIRKYINRQDLN